MIKNINDFAQEIHDWARSKGFYDREELNEGGPYQIENVSLPSEKVALMAEEVGELVKALRKGDPQNEAEECADIIIRVLDFCAWRGIDIEGQMEAKMAKNLDRPYLHDNGEGRVF